MNRVQRVMVGALVERLGEAAPGRHRGGAQDRRVHQLVREPHLEGPVAPDVLPGQDHVQRRAAFGMAAICVLVAGVALAIGWRGRMRG